MYWVSLHVCLEICTPNISKDTIKYGKIKLVWQSRTWSHYAPGNDPEFSCTFILQRVAVTCKHQTTQNDKNVNGTRKLSTSISFSVISYHMLGGHSNASVIHVRNQRNGKEGVFFLILNVILKNSNWGSKCANFQEKGSFFESVREVFRVGFRVNFQTPLFHQIYYP